MRSRDTKKVIVMIANTFCSTTRLAAAAALLLAASLVSPARAQTVVLLVNGEPITNYDIEQRSKLEMLTTHKQPDREKVINELIDDRVKIKEAKKYSIDPSSSDVDQLYGAMAGRMRMSGDQLSKMLESQGIRADTLKSKIRADTVWTNLVRGRFKESLLVNEKEVHAATLVNGDGTAAEVEGSEYTMRPVVLVVPHGAAPAEFESRKQEAEALRNRIQSCDEANSVFRTMRDAAIRDNVIKSSGDLPPPLRDMLDKTPIGHLTPPEVTKQGIEMVALCDRKSTKVDSAAKREVREKMFIKKYESKSNSYLQELRRAAMIERK